jgi:ElaB/YqjD/DUF883 family membrane-anchored ribosome-binding protein
MTNFSAVRANVQENAEHAAHVAGDVLRDKAAQASEALREGTEKVRAEAGTMARKAGERVSERPLTALVATLAIGAVAGYLLGRR